MMKYKLGGLLVLLVVGSSVADVLQIGGNSENSYAGPSVDRHLYWDSTYRVTNSSTLHTTLVSTGSGFTNGVGGVIADNDATFGSGLTITATSAYDASADAAPSVLTALNNQNLRIADENTMGVGDSVGLTFNKDIKLHYIWLPTFDDAGDKMTISWGGDTAGTVVLTPNVDGGQVYEPDESYHFAAGTIVKAGQEVIFDMGPDGNGSHFRSLIVETIPEPTTLGIVAMFGGGLIFLRRKMAI